jgi:hypothetical protein
MLNIIQVTTSLPTYVPRGSTHQPPDGGQSRNSLGGNPSRKPPFNSHVGSYGWPTLDPCMFIPPWYQPPIVQRVSKVTTKLPYIKLQCPTYVKDINMDAHIIVFKKAIKVNGELVEAEIINLFGFILKDNIIEWGENYVENHPSCTSEELEQAFCKQF